MHDTTPKKLDISSIENLKYRSPTLPNSSLGAPARLIFHTAHFQRLGRIKTLGVCSHSVDHNLIQNRLSHSVGVGLIAKEFLKNLIDTLPEEILIEQKYLNIVEIAGLCHDFGHGPFSHCFEQCLAKMNVKFVHEKQSLDVFDHMLTEHDFRNFFKQNFNFQDKDFELIKHLITGDSESYFKNVEGSCRIKENFLFQIIANRENGIDVDRWEYLTRDTCFASKEPIFDFKNLISNARVFIVNGESHIAYNENNLEDVLNLFRQRQENFTYIYMQANSSIGKELLSDILKLANKKTRIVESWLSSIPNFLDTDDTVMEDIEKLAKENGCCELLDLVEKFTLRHGYPLLALWEVSKSFDFVSFESSIKSSFNDIQIFANENNFITRFGADAHFDKIKLFWTENPCCFNFDVQKYQKTLPYANAKRIVLVSCKIKLGKEEKQKIVQKLDEEFARFNGSSF